MNHHTKKGHVSMGRMYLAAVIFWTLSLISPGAHTQTWRPSPEHTQVPIWPSGEMPDKQVVPGSEYMGVGKKHLVAGRPYHYVGNVSRPTMTVYSPKVTNTGVAVIVFPGGGFQILAIDLEGTEVCHWLTSNGITCVLLKYRVPSKPYNWRCDCRPYKLALSVPSLEDAQRTVRLVRFHAEKWHIDPHKVGVIGFSAGGYVVAEVSTNFNRHLYKPVDATDQESSRSDFAAAIYSGHLAAPYGLNANVPVSRETPPTFLVQAEDDGVDGVKQSLAYYAALKNADVPAEMHLYAHGGHAFGLRQTTLPITQWPVLFKTWLTTIGVITKDRVTQ